MKEQDPRLMVGAAIRKSGVRPSAVFLRVIGGQYKGQQSRWTTKPIEKSESMRSLGRYFSPLALVSYGLGVECG